MRVALVHDYLTQRGGAERVALALTRAFPGAPLYTSLYDPDGTFPEFDDVDVRTLPLNRLTPLRNHHRAALPLLAVSFSRLRVTADVVICSSSGWAHGTRVQGRKIVYCHTPARWLYQSDRYLQGSRRPVQTAAQLLKSRLVRWDKWAAATADCYLANSSVVAKRIKSVYGIEAEVVPPPPAMTPGGQLKKLEGVDRGFFLCVSRLLSYKNVDALIKAFGMLPDERLVIAGIGPAERALRSAAGANVELVGRVTDDQLRWLYANCCALITASHEDFGLTPLEAAGFGKPTAALRWGGFLDTIVEDRTGVFFDEPTPFAIAASVRNLQATVWKRSRIRRAAERFSEERFAERVTAAAVLPT